MSNKPEVTPPQFAQSTSSFPASLLGQRTTSRYEYGEPFTAQFCEKLEGVSNSDARLKLVNGIPADEWHSMSDQRRVVFMQEKRKQEAFKTEMCKGFISTGVCSYGNQCKFAHVPDELRVRRPHPKFKTELCRNYTINGICIYGSRCQFIHRSPPNGQRRQLNFSAPIGSRLSSSYDQQYCYQVLAMDRLKGVQFSFPPILVSPPLVLNEDASTGSFIPSYDRAPGNGPLNFLPYRTPKPELVNSNSSNSSPISVLNKNLFRVTPPGVRRHAQTDSIVNGSSFCADGTGNTMEMLTALFESTSLTSNGFASSCFPTFDNQKTR